MAPYTGRTVISVKKMHFVMDFSIKTCLYGWYITDDDETVEIQSCLCSSF